MIDLQGLAKSYGDFVAIPGLTLTVQAGEVYGFLGPNGAGKTTTIRMLMGILVPTSGRALIDGRDCSKDAVEVKRVVGYLPDNPIFYDYLMGREILEFVGQMHGLSKAAAKDKTVGLLQELDLADAAEEYAVNYSMGMKKKLGLACALIHDPAVLILDEPTNGLDPRSSRHVQERLKSLASQGRTIFLSTHLLDMADKICTRVGIIHSGKLRAEGSPSELRSHLTTGGTLEDVFLETTEA